MLSVERWVGRSLRQELRLPILVRVRSGWLAVQRMVVHCKVKRHEEAALSVCKHAKRTKKADLD